MRSVKTASAVTGSFRADAGRATAVDPAKVAAQPLGYRSPRLRGAPSKPLDMGRTPGDAPRSFAVPAGMPK